MLLSPHHGQSVHVSLVCRNDFSLGHFGRLIEGLWTQVTGALRSKRRDARRACVAVHAAHAFRYRTPPTVTRFCKGRATRSAAAQTQMLCVDDAAISALLTLLTLIHMLILM